jgi:probable O-glycosylation ligase (exosortase A-associated)
MAGDARAASAWRIGEARSELTSEAATRWLFLGYLLLLLVEYTGLPNDLPILKAIRFSTILSYSLLALTLMQVGLTVPFRTRSMKLFIAFIIFTMVSVLWAVVRKNAFDSIRPFVDYTVLFVLMFCLVDRQKRLDMLSWAFVVIACVLFVRNAAKLGQETRAGGFSAPYFMGDGNDFAWNMLVMLPVILNLCFGQRGMLTRLAGLGGAAVCVFSIVGTTSRGGTLGLIGIVLFVWLFISKRKLLGVALLALGATAVLALAPANYLTRMQSISTYEEDSSAQARLTAWGAAFDMAIDFPLGVGAGNFSSAYGRHYMATPTESAIGWANQRWLSAHSIYFKVLGEYGFLGVALLLWIMIGIFIDNWRTAKRAPAHGRGALISSHWPALVTASLVGFALGGIFLGGISYPHLFIIAGLSAAAQRALRSVAATPSAAVVRGSIFDAPAGGRVFEQKAQDIFASSSTSGR